jgi:hypothetical protein
MTWSNARQYCINDSNTIVNSTNKTNFTTHLIALEAAVETTSLIYWMKGYYSFDILYIILLLFLFILAWGIQSQFWTDGEASSSAWNWSSQEITWYFNSSDQIIYGNGSNYRIVYSTIQNTYQVTDTDNNKLSNFICEYQG